MDVSTGRYAGLWLVNCVQPHMTPKIFMLYPKGDGGLGTYNLGKVDREESLECVGTLKN
jgi:hypothetical protein